MIDLKNLVIKDGSAKIVGKCEFSDLNGTAYCMTDGGRVSAGVSFVYEGGKFSGQLDPVIAEQISKALDGGTLNFSRVILEVSPGSFGREKRSGLRLGKVLHLESVSGVIYSVLEGAKPTNSSTKGQKAS